MNPFLRTHPTCCPVAKLVINFVRPFEIEIESSMMLFYKKKRWTSNNKIGPDFALAFYLLFSIALDFSGCCFFRKQENIRRCWINIPQPLRKTKNRTLESHWTKCTDGKNKQPPSPRCRRFLRDRAGLPAHKLFTWLSPVLHAMGHRGRRDFVSLTITFEIRCHLPRSDPHFWNSLVVVCFVF